MKKLLLFMLFLSARSIWATPTNKNTSIFYDTKVITDHVLNCSLPAPNSVAVVAQSAASVSLAWTAVSGASDYRIVTYESVSGNYVSTTYHTATSGAVTGLLPGTTYSFFVSAGCGGAEYSENAAKTEGQTDFIIDLIANGYETIPNNFIGQWGIGASTNINFTPYKEYLGIIYQVGTEAYSRFVFKFMPDLTPPTAEIYPISESNGLNGNTSLGSITNINKNTCDGQTDNLPQVYLANCSAATSHIHCRMKASLIGVNGLGTLTLSDQNTASNYFIEIYDNEGGNKQKTSNNTIPIQITAAPNPFSSELNLILPRSFQTKNTGISVSLTDLNGRVFVTQHIPYEDIEDTVLLPTTGLPIGMYIAKVQSDDYLQTIKVVKTMH